MLVDLQDVRTLISIEESHHGPTGDSWLDARYAEDSQPYYRLFYRLARAMMPKHVVELGTYRASAAAHFAVGWPYAMVTTIDLHDSDAIARDKAHEVFYMYDNVAYIQGCTWSDVVVAQVASRDPIDILFIDAAHEYVQAIREWRAYSALLADEALVVCHDIFDAVGYTVDMVRFWNEVSKGRECFLNHTMHNRPMGFMRYTRD